MLLQVQSYSPQMKARPVQMVTKKVSSSYIPMDAEEISKIKNGMSSIAKSLAPFIASAGTLILPFATLKAILPEKYTKGIKDKDSKDVSIKLTGDGKSIKIDATKNGENIQTLKLNTDDASLDIENMYIDKKGQMHQTKVRGDVVEEAEINSPDSNTKQKMQQYADTVSESVVQMKDYKSSNENFNPKEVQIYENESLKKEYPGLAKMFRQLFPDKNLTVQIQDRLLDCAKSLLWFNVKDADKAEICKGIVSADGDEVVYNIGTNDMRIKGVQTDSCSKYSISPVLTAKQATFNLLQQKFQKRVAKNPDNKEQLQVEYYKRAREAGITGARELKHILGIEYRDTYTLPTLEKQYNEKYTIESLKTEYENLISNLDASTGHDIKKLACKIILAKALKAGVTDGRSLKAIFHCDIDLDEINNLKIQIDKEEIEAKRKAMLATSKQSVIKRNKRHIFEMSDHVEKLYDELVSRMLDKRLTPEDKMKLNSRTCNNVLAQAYLDGYNRDELIEILVEILDYTYATDKTRFAGRTIDQVADDAIRTAQSGQIKAPKKEKTTPVAAEING